MAGCNGEDIASQGGEPLHILNHSSKIRCPKPDSGLALLENKYGGIVPKKKPLISKDNERAYFDSADWALGKQGTNMGQNAVESLRPKLQRTPHHRLPPRMPACTTGAENRA